MATPESRNTPFMLSAPMADAASKSAVSKLAGRASNEIGAGCPVIPPEMWPKVAWGRRLRTIEASEVAEICKIMSASMTGGVSGYKAACEYIDARVTPAVFGVTDDVFVVDPSLYSAVCSSLAQFCVTAVSTEPANVFTRCRMWAVMTYLSIDSYFVDFDIKMGDMTGAWSSSGARELGASMFVRALDARPSSSRGQLGDSNVLRSIYTAVISAAYTRRIVSSIEAGMPRRIGAIFVSIASKPRPIQEAIVLSLPLSMLVEFCWRLKQWSCASVILGAMARGSPLEIALRAAMEFMTRGMSGSTYAEACRHKDQIIDAEYPGGMRQPETAASIARFVRVLSVYVIDNSISAYPYCVDPSLACPQGGDGGCAAIEFASCGHTEMAYRLVSAHPLMCNAVSFRGLNIWMCLLVYSRCGETATGKDFLSMAVMAEEMVRAWVSTPLGIQAEIPSSVQDAVLSAVVQLAFVYLAVRRAIFNNPGHASVVLSTLACVPSAMQNGFVHYVIKSAVEITPPSGSSDTMSTFADPRDGDSNSDSMAHRMLSSCRTDKPRFLLSPLSGAGDSKFVESLKTWMRLKPTGPGKASHPAPSRPRGEACEDGKTDAVRIEQSLADHTAITGAILADVAEIAAASLPHVTGSYNPLVYSIRHGYDIRATAMTGHEAAHSPITQWQAMRIFTEKGGERQSEHAARSGDIPQPGISGQYEQQLMMF